MNRHFAIPQERKPIDRQIVVVHATARSREIPLTSRDWGLLIGVSVLLIYAILAFGSVDEWAICILETGSALLLLMYVWPYLSSGNVQLRSHRMYFPMIVFGLVIFLQILLRTTAYVYLTRYELWKYVAYGNLFVIANGFRRSVTQRLLEILAVAGLIIALFAIVQDLTYNDKIYWIAPSVFHAFGPYFNSNHYAGLMEMLTPIAFAIPLAYREQPHKLFWTIAGIVMAATIFVCGSRGGMISLVIQLIVLAAFLVSRKNTRMAWGLVAIFVLIGTLAVWLDNGRVLERLNMLRNPLNNSDIINRLTIAKDSLRMVRDRPILGWGLGLFRTIYPRYRSYSTELVVNEAHNDYVQVLVETGILGFGCVVWFIVNLYRSGVANLRSQSRDGMLRASGPLVGCTGILVHSLSDFNLQIPANAALFCVLCGIASGGDARIRN